MSHQKVAPAADLAAELAAAADRGPDALDHEADSPVAQVETMQALLRAQAVEHARQSSEMRDQLAEIMKVMRVANSGAGGAAGAGPPPSPGNANSVGPPPGAPPPAGNESSVGPPALPATTAWVTLPGRTGFWRLVNDGEHFLPDRESVVNYQTGRRYVCQLPPAEQTAVSGAPTTSAAPPIYGPPTGGGSRRRPRAGDPGGLIPPAPAPVHSATDERADRKTFEAVRHQLVKHCMSTGDMIGAKDAIEMIYSPTESRGIAAAAEGARAAEGSVAGIAATLERAEPMGMVHFNTLVNDGMAPPTNLAGLHPDDIYDYLKWRATQFCGPRAELRACTSDKRVFSACDFGRDKMLTAAGRDHAGRLFSERDTRVNAHELQRMTSDTPQLSEAEFLAASLLRIESELVVTKGLGGPTLAELKRTMSLACLMSTSKTKSDHGRRVFSREVLVANYFLKGALAFEESNAATMPSIDKVEGHHREAMSHAFDPTLGMLPGPPTISNHLTLLDWMRERRSEEDELCSILYAAVRKLHKSHELGDGPYNHERRGKKAVVHGKALANRICARFLFCHFYLRGASSFRRRAPSASRVNDPLRRPIFLCSPDGPLAELCALQAKNNDTLLDRAIARKTFARGNRFPRDRG